MFLMVKAKFANIIPMQEDHAFLRIIFSSYHKPGLKVRQLCQYRNVILTHVYMQSPVSENVTGGPATRIYK